MENSTEVILVIIVGSLVMVMFILFIVFFGLTYNRKFREREATHQLQIKEKEIEMLKAIYNAQENEREQLSFNLHDEVGPLLSALKYRIVKYKRMLGRGELEAGQLDEEGEQIDQIIDNVRTVSHNLSPRFLSKFGIIAAIKNHVHQIENPTIEVKANFSTTETIDKLIISNLYRIILELINNTLKHDSPTQFDAIFTMKDNKMIVELIHNGKGMTLEEFEKNREKSTGLGLDSIMSRVVLINGNLSFDKTKTGLSRILLTTPI